MGDGNRLPALRIGRIAARCLSRGGAQPILPEGKLKYTSRSHLLTPYNLVTIVDGTRPPHYHLAFDFCVPLWTTGRSRATPVHQ